MSEQLPKRPHMALATSVTPDHLKWADEHSRRCVLASDLEATRLFALALESSNATLRAENARLAKVVEAADLFIREQNASIRRHEVWVGPSGHEHIFYETNPEHAALRERRIVAERAYYDLRTLSDRATPDSEVKT